MVLLHRRLPALPPDNGPHPTANNATLIVSLSVAALNARRVRPGVRFLPVR